MKNIETLYDEVKKLHEDHKALKDFIDFPSDIVPKIIEPHWVAAAGVLIKEKGLLSNDYKTLCDTIIGSAKDVIWRETYKGTNIGNDFLDKFACYEIIGRDAPFASNKMRSFVIYQPPGVYYPWHQHPAEEIYVVLAGKAKFSLEKSTSRILNPGDHAFHPSNQPHALETLSHPVMAYVGWRNEFDTVPIWTID